MENKTLIEELRTVVAVTVTPLGDHGEIDGTTYTRMVQRMRQAGVSVFTPNGNTGEFYALTVDEAARMVDLTVDAVGDDALVLPGVGHDPATAAAMAASAARSGARAVMVHHPVAPYLSVNGWLDYHAAVADAVPDVGIVAYVRDPKIGAGEVARLLERVPSLVGIKYAIPDLFALTSVISGVGSDRLAWICGLAERWAPFFWLAGARGFTSGLANVAPEASIALLEHLRAGRFDEAMLVWRSVSPIEEIRSRAGGADNVSALKEALQQLGLGGRTVRPPSSLVAPQTADAIADLLRSWEIYHLDAGAAV